MEKSKKKSGNKYLIATISICVSIVLVIILLVALIDPIVGRSKLKKVKYAAENCNEIVISSPLYQDSFLQGAEAVVTGNEMDELTNTFIRASEGVSYDESFDSFGGFWHTKLEFHTSDERYAVYLKDDEIYVVKDTKAYQFDIEDECKEVYETLLNRINQILSDSVK